MDVMPRIDSAGRSAFDTGRRSRRIDARDQRRRTVQFVLRRQGKSAARRVEDGEARRCRQTKPEDGAPTPEDKKTDAGVIGSVIDKSPESARLFVFGSNTFLSIRRSSMIGSAEGTVYGNSLQLIANAVDWSLEDPSVARDPLARPLQPHAAAARGSAAHDARILELRHCARAARLDLRHPPLARKTRVAKYHAWLDHKSFDASKGEPA